MSIAMIRLLICLYAIVYGVPQNVALEVARLESDFDVIAIGDDGRAHGLFQIHLPLWGEQRARMGLPTDDLRLDPRENIRVAMFTMSQGLGRRWSTWDLAKANVTPPRESILRARLRRVQARYEVMP